MSFFARTRSDKVSTDTLLASLFINAEDIMELGIILATVVCGCMSSVKHSRAEVTNICCFDFDRKDSVVTSMQLILLDIVCFSSNFYQKFESIKEQRLVEKYFNGLTDV